MSVALMIAVAAAILAVLYGVIMSNGLPICQPAMHVCKRLQAPFNKALLLI